MISALIKRIIEKAYQDKMGHIPSALSILDIVWVLYDKVMTKNDQFILSKGHGCMALYAVLEAKGLLDWSTKLWGHPKRGGAILASTGSLGHGLPMAIGLAKANLIKFEQGKELKHTVFCLIGDGECNEGTTWESAMLAANYNLHNLVLIIDQNHSSDRSLNTGNLLEKFKAFGWAGWEANDDLYSKLLSSYSLGTTYNSPTVCVVNTIKGHGIPMLENNWEWHNRTPNDAEFNEIMKSLA